MKTLSPALQAHLDDGTTTLSWCWRISRSDGVALGFTDHDRTLSFDGTAFEPESGLAASEIRSGSDLAVDAQDASGVLTSDRITETDILDGRWDNAGVELWRVNWADPGQRVLLRRGAVGQIRRGRMAFVAEVRSMAHVLGQTVGRTFQAGCMRAWAMRAVALIWKTPSTRVLAWSPTCCATARSWPRGYPVLTQDGSHPAR